MGISEELGGIVTITVAAIIITGILGNMMGPTLCKLFGITDEVAQGVAFGTSAHVIGTAKANEISGLTGAASRGRRCHEQSFYCGCRTYNGCRINYFLSIILKI